MLPQNPNGTTPLHGESKDDLQRRLQESLKKKRPRTFRLALGILLLASGLLAFLAWLVYPPGEPPLLVVVALDDLAVAGTEVSLHGRLEPLDDIHARLAGHNMVFVNGPGVLPGQEVGEMLAKTGPEGETSCKWTFPAGTAQGNFFLRLIQNKFRPGMEDRGQILLAPSATPLCLVQIDEALTTADAQAWAKENIQDILPTPGAAQALEEARIKGFVIVYVAVAANRPMVYQKMRGWVLYHGAEGTLPLPAGVVLSRFTLPGADQDKRPWQKTGELLRSRFIVPSKHLAIAGTLEAARQFHAADLRTLYLGNEKGLPGEIKRVNEWEEIRLIVSQGSE